MTMLEADAETPTPTPNSERQKFLWQRPKQSRNPNNGHKVSFSASSNRSRENGYSSHSDSSRPSSPALKTFEKPELWKPPINSQNLTPAWKKVNRQGELIWQDSNPSPAPSPTPHSRPFLIYNDSFLHIIGAHPTLQLLVHDTRANYFQNAGIFTPKTNTLYLTSSPLQDQSPSAAPSRNLQVVISKIDLFSGTDFSRDKVRTPEHNYMPSSGCSYNGGIVLCAQGTFAETASLIFVDVKRPHRTQSLLTDFHGTPFNSPHTCVAHADGSLWFSDPHLAHSPSFRPRPRLPPLIYRFDPQSSDLRAMTNEIARPTALAFSPNHRTLYVLDAAQTGVSSGNAAPTAASQSTIYAFSVAQASSFLTARRLFALPASPPVALAVDVFGNVYAACQDGVHVFNDCGSLIGKILIEGGATGLCFSRAGELWACGGDKLWRIQMDQETKGAALRI